MAYTITTGDVLDGFSTSASTADLEAYIEFANQADACLTSNGVGEAIGQRLKVMAVRHLASNANDGGQVVSQRAVSGASRTFAEKANGETGYLQTLRSLDTKGCVIGLLSNNARVQLRSAGRSNL